jgi:hypothetical protein
MGSLHLPKIPIKGKRATLSDTMRASFPGIGT